MNAFIQNNHAYVMRFGCSEATAIAIADLASELLNPDETAIAMFEVGTTTRNWKPVPWAVEIYFQFPPDEAHIRDLVAQVVGFPAAKGALFAPIAEQDWVARSLAGLGAVRVGRFIVHGAHDRARVAANDIGIEIEAALAFGTGHHGTTRGCLLMLEHVLKRRRPRHVLDVGTGTGVLAIAAARRLHQCVAAGDIDAVSVHAARSNASRNGAGPWLRPVVARGVGHPDLARKAHFDLVLANILARPLRLLAPGLAAVANRGAELVLSGLLAGDVAGVLSAYRAQGFYLARRVEIEGWSSLLLTRSGF